MSVLVAIDVLQPEDVPELVHHGGQQVHPAEGLTRRGRLQRCVIDLPPELAVVRRGEINEPPVPGARGVDQDGVADGLPERQALEVCNLERDRLQAQ